jgi:hypothetical protein
LEVIRATGFGGRFDLGSAGRNFGFGVDGAAAAVAGLMIEAAGA